jgi:hypothetical protein
MTAVRESVPSRSQAVTPPVRYGGLARSERTFAALMILPTVIAVLAITAYPMLRRYPW